jgi:hypothetical protein
MIFGKESRRGVPAGRMQGRHRHRAGNTARRVAKTMAIAIVPLADS